MNRFFTEKEYKQLLTNGASRFGNHDHVPVVKLFLPDENATWLLTSIDPKDHTEAFGLSDWGNGYPEVGPISLETLENIEDKHGFEVSRDAYFEAKFPLSVYAYAAEDRGGIIDRIGGRYDITEDEYNLEKIYQRMYGDGGLAPTPG